MADLVTIIGKETKISGNLQGDEDLTVLGRVEGTIQLAKTLQVEPGGVVMAEVKVRDLIVSGVVVGNVTAGESVHITDSGRMMGDIVAPRVIIVDGAMFRGQIDMGDIEAERPSGPSPTRKPAAAPAPAPRPTTQHVTVRPAAPKGGEAVAKAPKPVKPAPRKGEDLRRPAPKRSAPPPVMPKRKGKVTVKRKK